MQSFGPHPKSHELETLGMESSRWCFNKYSGWFWCVYSGLKTTALEPTYRSGSVWLRALTILASTAFFHAPLLHYVSFYHRAFEQLFLESLSLSSFPGYYLLFLQVLAQESWQRLIPPNTVYYSCVVLKTVVFFFSYLYCYWLTSASLLDCKLQKNWDKICFCLLLSAVSGTRIEPVLRCLLNEWIHKWMNISFQYLGTVWEHRQPGILMVSSHSSHFLQWGCLPHGFFETVKWGNSWTKPSTRLGTQVLDKCELWPSLLLRLHCYYYHFQFPKSPSVIMVECS